MPAGSGSPAALELIQVSQGNLAGTPMLTVAATLRQPVGDAWDFLEQARIAIIVAGCCPACCRIPESGQRTARR